MIVAAEKNKIPFIDGWEEHSKSKKSPGWWTTLREQSLTQFAQLGLPTIKDEEWKYTNVSPLIQRKYRLADRIADVRPEQIAEFIGEGEILVVFVNGLFSAQLSRVDALPKGLHLCPLSEAVQNNATEIQTIAKKFSELRPASFAALNQALASDGVFIKIDDTTVLNQAIHLIHVATDKNIYSAPRNIISIGKSAEAVVIETHLCADNADVYLTNGLTDISLAENSHLLYCNAQADSRASFQIATTRVWQDRNSNLNTFCLTTGSAIVRNNLDVILDGEGANSILNGLYSVSGTQLVDNHTAVDHRVPNCISNQLYKGILNGSSRAVFNGKIFVRPIAQQTNSYQLNKNLILGKDCQVDTKPQLEIGADDVKCTHGATIGQLNEDEIFYLQTRNIGRKDAIRMLSHGFVDDILNTIPNEEIRRKLNILLAPTFAEL